MFQPALESLSSPLKGKQESPECLFVLSVRGGPLTERGCAEVVTTRANTWMNLSCQTKLLKNHERGGERDHLA